MGAILALIPALLPIFKSLIEKVFPDKVEQDKAMLALQQALNEAQAKFIDASKDVIVTEMQQGGWASQWRSYLMMVCTGLIGFNWMIAPILNSFLKLCGIEIITTPIPPEAWTLVTVGLGGYVGKETMSIYAGAKYGPTNDKKFFDILRQKIFKSGMSQDQVDALEEALKARDNS